MYLTLIVCNVPADGQAMLDARTFADTMMTMFLSHVNGLAQDCSDSIADTLELWQSSSKPLIWDQHLKG